MRKRWVGRSQVRRGRRGRRPSRRGSERVRLMIVASKILGWMWPKKRSVSLSMVSLQTCFRTNGWHTSWSNSRVTLNPQVSHSSVSTGRKSCITSFLLTISNRQRRCVLQPHRDSKCASTAPQSSTWTVAFDRCGWNPKSMAWLWGSKHSCWRRMRIYRMRNSLKLRKISFKAMGASLLKNL